MSEIWRHLEFMTSSAEETEAMSWRTAPQVIRANVLRRFSCAENPLEIFDGYCLHQGVRVRSARRWFGQAPDRIGEFLNSRVILAGHELDYGDDPRVFVHQGRIHLHATMYTAGFGFRNHLIEILSPTEWRRYFLMLPDGVEQGKNWSPFEFPDGQLGFIHSFTPLRILREFRRENGIILFRVIEQPSNNPEEGDYSGFPAHRGGSNGIRFDQRIFGVGHTTRKVHDSTGAAVSSESAIYPNNHQLIHRPFAWCLDFPTLALTISDIDYQWDPNYWIADPTSLIRDDASGRIHLITTEVERSFVDPSGSGRVVEYELSLFEE